MSKLKIAAKLVLEEWVATLPTELPEPEYSKKHIRKMNKLIDKMRGDRYHYFTTRAVRVMVVAAILAALALSAFVFPSSRDSIIKTFGIDSLHRMTEGNNNCVSSEIKIGYIPEGFELAETDVEDKVVWNLYESKDDKDFIVYKFTSTNATYFDTEQYNYEEVIYNGKEYKAYKNSNSDYGLIWINNDYIYEINGTVSLDELLKIAESVK